MEVFRRDDGRDLNVVAGFRDRVLAAPRGSVQPKTEWTDDDYRAAAAKKVEHAERFVATFAQFGGTLDGARVLELGCGPGIDTLQLALHPVGAAIGIDLDLPLFEPSERGERMRRLTREILAILGQSNDVDAVHRQRPLGFARADATRLPVPDHSVDLLWSRAAMEHIVPPEPALAEMARVVRPGGLIHHGIDPFYWLKGCHKAGVVDLPWAHARLTPAEYHRFVAEHEGATRAARRSRHLLTLNQLTPRQWRRTLEAGPFEILDWHEERSPLAETLPAEYPEVPATVRPGVEHRDLIHGRLKLWLRRRP